MVFLLKNFRFFIHKNIEKSCPKENPVPNLGTYLVSGIITKTLPSKVLATTQL
jgi:hypothetical protein